MEKILLYHSSMIELAERIAHSPSIILGKIDWSFFEDEFPSTAILNIERIRGADVSFLASFEKFDLILEQLFVMRALPRYGVSRLRIILPYFPGTMDRVDCEGQIATAKSLAREVESMPFCRDGGPAELVVFDIHSLQERFYFNDNVIPHLMSGIHLLRKRIQSMENIAIAFPDEGAWKRFGTKFPEYPHLVCQKVRNGDQRVVTLKEGEPRGQHVIIVDDLIKTGNTVLECRNVLKAAGATAVSVYATHGVFPQASWKKFVDEGFANVWITDSCPATMRMVRNIKPFEILSLANDLAATVISG